MGHVMADASEMPKVPEFRLSPEGEFAIRFEVAGWRVAKMTPTDRAVTDEDVKGWVALVPTFVVSALAETAEKNLEEVKAAVENLGNVHDQVVGEVRDELDVAKRKVAIYENFIRDLLQQPIVGLHYRTWFEDAFENADLEFDL